ncbi:alkyl/aryl-sulfatase [Phenylobacterium sp.]|uniref:alkyl/aryl-sulfatase n=1 Tax=Phenylobacterium sp. TaxID=1871053 RepID=UPI00398392B1
MTALVALGVIAGAPGVGEGAERASAATVASQAATLKALPFADRQDFDFATRGFVGTRLDPKIPGPNGLAWDLSAYDFLQGTAPATVNPSLWRQAQLLARHGLFKVADRIWQVRGFDIANITFIRGDTGWIVIDALTTRETAGAAYALVTEKLGPRPVVALIYTHSHSDHFGGARGLVDQTDVDSGKVKVIAPAGFLAEAVSENVLAGNAMSRRATYQFGFFLPPGPQGQVSSGIGQAISKGTMTLVPPNLTIDRTGQELTIDGVRLQFQLTPGTEAPAEMNINLPDLHVLDMAENANVSMHNVLTPRGALVRDAKAWSEHLTQSIRLYGAGTEVMIASHGWPRFGNEAVIGFLADHRDGYKYLHDQTVRMMNEGLTGPEIANRIALPPALARRWFNRGYYGTMSFNARAVYQRYMGFYDANPASLAPLDPADQAARYVAAMGGAAQVLELARAAADAADYRWAATLLNNLVLTDSSDIAARQALAGVYDQLGYQAESALWRNIYLSGAMELRSGVRSGTSGGSIDLIRNLPSPMLFDLIGVRLNPQKISGGDLRLELVFPERSERFYLTVRNGVLVAEAVAASGPVDATVTLPRAALISTLFLGAPLAGAHVDGDSAALERLIGWLDAFKPDFPIVTR